MIIICEKHGPAQGSLATPALIEKINQGLPISRNDYVKVEYEYLSQTAEIFHLDSATDARYGAKSERLPLPDEYPAFVAELKPVCYECLKEALEKGRRFALLKL